MPATPPVHGDGKQEPFKLHYDALVLAVGAYNQSMCEVGTHFGKTDRLILTAFNVPGVKEHAHFLKDISNARAIRSRILECMLK